MQTSEIIRDMVKEIMKDSGVKQKYIANECGYTEKQFSMLINGYKSITDEDIRKLCIGLGKSPNDFFAPIPSDNKTA